MICGDDGSFHAAARASDHLPVLMCVCVCRSNAPGRLVCHNSPELVRAEQCQVCLARLTKSLDRSEQIVERYSVMAELARSAARQASALLSSLGLSQPALLAQAVMRVHALAKAGKLKGAGEIAGAVPRIGRV